MSKRRRLNERGHPIDDNAGSSVSRPRRRLARDSSHGEKSNSNDLFECKLSVRNHRTKIRIDDCHTIHIDGKVVLFKVKNIWKKYRKYYIQGALYLKPEDINLNTSQSAFGEHELVQFNHEIILDESQLNKVNFSRSKDQSFHPGIRTYTPENVVIKKYDTKEYVKLLSPRYKLRRNVSGTIATKRLLAGELKDLEYDLKIWKTRKAEGESRPCIVPKFEVLSYEDYCYFRKWKAAMETGLMLPKHEIKKYHLVNEIGRKALFSQKVISSRTIKKWLRTNKYSLSDEIRSKRPHKLSLYTDAHHDSIADDMYRNFRGVSTSGLEEKVTKVIIGRKRKHDVNIIADL